jgi:hypothetical protein
MTSGCRLRAAGSGPDLAVDEDGSVFVADYKANRIRRIDARSGVIRTVAGNGKGSRVEILL